MIVSYVLGGYGLPPLLVVESRNRLARCEDGHTWHCFIKARLCRTLPLSDWEFEDLSYSHSFCNTDDSEARAAAWVGKAQT